jgi:plasmid stabilization system protein ParE
MTRLTFHPRVAADVSRILSYYEEVGGQRLADEFYAELRSCSSWQLRPLRATRPLRGIYAAFNLERFPYHFLYRIVRDRVRVLVVRHHKRHPSLGISRR